MTAIRVIARLDIKNDKLIKSIQLEGVQVIGDPNEYAKRYYQQGADEIIFMDAVASLYGRNHLHQIITDTALNVFIPITVGGGLRSIEDIDLALKAGADKVAINTAVVENPSLITEVANHFGSQCMVLQIDAKRQDNSWEVYVEGGREKTSLDVIEWAQKCVGLGAGEILLTSVDYEGTAKGFDLELIQAVSSAVTVPVIACGGMSYEKDFVSAVKAKADAVAMAHILHIENKSIQDIKNYADSNNIEVRLACE